MVPGCCIQSSLFVPTSIFLTCISQFLIDAWASVKPPVGLYESARRLSCCPRNATKLVTYEVSMTFANMAVIGALVVGVIDPYWDTRAPYRDRIKATTMESPDKTVGKNETESGVWKFNLWRFCVSSCGTGNHGIYLAARSWYIYFNGPYPDLLNFHSEIPLPSLDMTIASSANGMCDCNEGDGADPSLSSEAMLCGELRTMLQTERCRPCKPRNARSRKEASYQNSIPHRYHLNRGGAATVNTTKHVDTFKKRPDACIELLLHRLCLHTKI
jgi:hypothetical protein